MCFNITLTCNFVLKCILELSHWCLLLLQSSIFIPALSFQEGKCNLQSTKYLYFKSFLPINISPGLGEDNFFVTLGYV